MAGDLDFNVQLRVLNEQFNRGIDSARDKFTQYAQSVQRNVQQMNTDTERASTMLAGLANVDSSRLTSELQATADQLRQMGAGANISGDQIEQAMEASALQVTRLGRQLEVARSEALRLSQTSASPEDIEQAAANVNRLEQELNQARSASVSLANELSGAMNRASTTADNARNALYRMANIRVPETIRGEIDQINRTLVNFQQNSGRPAAEIERATRAAEEQIRRLENELNGVDDTIRRTDVSTNSFSGNVGKLRTAMSGLTGLLAAAGIGIGAAEIIEMSDAFVTLEAKVKLATGEGAAFVTGFQGVTDIAKETFTSIENTGELFARITQASESLGLAQGEILSVTKTINEAIKLSGGSAASADAAIIQLVQGLQSGVVRGEEFNSIMEQAPRLATAMADGLGVTKGELRAMAAEGKLTSEVVIDAVRSQTQTINDEFATLPTTFANSVQNMKTTVFELVGSLNETVNQSGRLAQGIQYISDAIDNIDPATMAALGQSFDFVLEQSAALFTLVKDIYGAFSDLTSIINGTVAAGNDVGLITKLMQQFAVTTGVAIDGIRGLSIAADSVFGTISGIIGSVLIGIAKLNGETSTMGEALIAKQEELYARSEQKMMDFKSKSGEAWAEMNKTAQDRLDETVVEVVKNYDEMVAKGDISAAAMEEQYIKVAKAKIEANNMIITDDMRLELAGQGLQASISDTNDVIVESSKGVQAAYLGVGQSFAEVALKAQVSGTSMRESLTDAVPKAQTIGAVDDIISSLSALGSQGKISGEDMAFGINLANERYKEIESNFARYAAKTMADNGGIVTSELEKTAALQGLAIQANETGGAIVTQLDKSTVASGRTKDEIDKLAGAAGVGLSAGFIKSKEGLDELVDGYDDLEKAGYDAGGAVINALTEMSNKASNTAEIENLTLTWNELYKEGKITGQELADGLEGVKNRVDILKDGINGVTEAYGFLGLKTREELAKDAQAYTESYSLVMKQGELTAQQQEEVFTKTAKANIAANGGVIDSFTRAQAAAKGYTVEVDENGRVVVEKAGRAVSANDNVTRSVNNIRTAYDGISSSAGGAGNAMVRAANEASSAYDKLQQKIKSVKEAQELKNADETLRNLRQYGTEDAPIEGNQFGTRLGVENFLKSQGLSEESAIEEARKLYAKQGTSSGALNFGELQGFSDGQMLTAADINRYKSASVYLAEIAEKARQVDRQRDNYEVARTATAQITTQEYNRYDSQPSSSKTINVNFKLGGATASMSMPESQEASLTALLQQLQDSKAIAGY
ncbi:putative tail length tape measure protein [Psychrobacter nivimaris]|uniref:Putative tail length tape measure protein n=1 Tax=Psychrobacter nivimaris TaxID=281738 RepID=A0A6N7C0S4_9GAMM|nr:tape measure protein [Psychrobacter nivimaris]KAF0569515.1 putative tail length tape measure protein [Psychrobacter nivimaris]